MLRPIPFHLACVPAGLALGLLLNLGGNDYNPLFQPHSPWSTIAPVMGALFTISAVAGVVRSWPACAQGEANPVPGFFRLAVFVTLAGAITGMSVSRQPWVPAATVFLSTLAYLWAVEHRHPAARFPAGALSLLVLCFVCFMSMPFLIVLHLSHPELITLGLWLLLLARLLTVWRQPAFPH